MGSPDTLADPPAGGIAAIDLLSDASTRVNMKSMYWMHMGALAESILSLE